MKDYKNQELCNRRGGICCKGFTGIVSPDDIKVTVDNITEMLLSLKYIIWVNEDYCLETYIWLKTYYLRPARKNKTYIFDDSLNKSECIFLTDKGCSLKREDMPLGCRSLEPREDREKHGCYSHWDHDEAISSWKPYQDNLIAAKDKAYDEFYNLSYKQPIPKY